MTEPEQIDLEEVIEASGGKPSFKTLREDRREKLVTMAREVERYLQEAKDKNSPLAKELAVRAGKRTVDDLFRKVRALATVADPPRYHTQPTQERENHAGEAAKATVIYHDNKAQSVNHRWLWPVEQARRLGFLSPSMIMAAVRFRDAFNDQQRMPGPTYSDEPRVHSDPTKRNGLTAANLYRQSQQLALAGGECGWVWKRLEPEFQAVVWGLILEEPFPNGGAPLSVVMFGQEISGSRTEAHGRWFAYGLLRSTTTRLATLFNAFDIDQKKLNQQIEPARALIDNAETEKHLWQMPERKALTGTRKSGR